jgi:hypothetical protein
MRVLKGGRFQMTMAEETFCPIGGFIHKIWEVAGFNDVPILIHQQSMSRCFDSPSGLNVFKKFQHIWCEQLANSIFISPG